MTDVDEVVAELKRLSRGRGLQAGNLPERVGPALVVLLELELDQPVIEIRRQAQSVMLDAARSLTPDLRMAVLTTLGVDGWFAGPMLQDRIGAVAVRIDREARTVRRRIDVAFAQLADGLIARRSPPPAAQSHAPTGWYVENLRSTLDLDGPRSRLTEDRVIVAELDGLTELTISLSAPPLSGGTPVAPKLEAALGCRLAGSRQVSNSYWSFTLALPRVLRLGERHRYVVTFTGPPIHEMRPYYVLTPLRRVRHFSAEIHFGQPGRLEAVWRVDGMAPSVLRDDQPTDQPCTVGPDGIVAVAFDGLVQGLSYGAAWRWLVADTAEPDVH